MSNLEEQVLDEALMKTYAEFGITNDNSSLEDPEHPGRFRKMPVLEDLHRHLSDNPRAEQMSIILNRFVNGSARSMFNGQTNVDLSNPYTVLDLTFLKNKIMLSAGMFVVLDMVWDIARQNRMEQKAIVIDEVWQLIGSNSNALAAEYVVEIAKVARAFNTAAIFATQDIHDFFSLDDGKYGKAILAACKCKVILNLEPHEAEKAGEILNLTATEVHKIKHFERGHGLLSSNGNNIAVRFRASDLERGLISTDPEELRQILEKKRGASPIAATSEVIKNDAED
jgi:type IV secretory pathway VirB4 component